MEGGESILESIYDEDDIEDVEMLDIEEGELIEEKVQDRQEESSGGDANAVMLESCSKSRKRKNKKKNKKRNNRLGLDVTDIDGFVLKACARLKEKKSYMVYTAVSCLGISAVGDLIKEVDAIEICGGQMTANGNRYRTGGGILWNIIKTREPKAYKEIMNKAKEFEKQFKPRNIRQETAKNKHNPRENADTLSNQITGVPDNSELDHQIRNGPANSNGEEQRVSVHNRIRVPVSYDDLLGDDPKDEVAA